MGTDSEEGQRFPVKLYREAIEGLLRGLPKEYRKDGVRRIVEGLRRIYEQAGVDPPWWLDKVLPPEQR